MIFLTLLYFCLFSGPWNTLALPTDWRPLTRNHVQSIFIHDEDRFDLRSTYIILRSYISTIFACSWTAVHPNVPAPGDTKWIVMGRRMAIMGYILLAPEIIIFWAARQHFAARNFAKKHEKNHTGWTRAHSFFLIMGGSTLHASGNPVRVLEAKDLEELSEAGRIEWPTISEEGIADRSKGDYLSKTIVLLQMTWFLIRCIVRGAYGLTIPKLEVVTLAFAIYTGIIYYLWWDKPLDVCCSVPVHLLDHCLGKIENDVRKGDIGSQIISPPEVSDQEIQGDGKVVDLNSLPSTPNTSTAPSTLTNTGYHVIPPQNVSHESMPGDEAVIHLNPLPPTPVQDDRSSPDPPLTRMQRSQATLFKLGYMFTVFPLKHFVIGVSDMFHCNTLGDHTLRVPTFYSPPKKRKDTIVVGLITGFIGTAFGIIHWNLVGTLSFSNPKEVLVWEMSAIIVSLVPVILTSSVLIGIVCGLKVKVVVSGVGVSDYHFLYVCVNFASIFIYLIARITLLILALTELSSLPVSAYFEPSWTSLFPHL